MTEIGLLLNERGRRLVRVPIHWWLYKLRCLSADIHLFFWFEAYSSAGLLFWCSFLVFSFLVLICSSGVLVFLIFSLTFLLVLSFFILLFWHSPSPPAADTCLSAAVASFSSIRRGRENHHREKQKSSLIFSGFWSSVRMAVVSLVVSHSERNR